MKFDINIFETPIDHGMPYHIYVLTLKKDTVLYSAFSYGKKKDNNSQYEHNGTTHGGIHGFLLENKNPVLSGGNVHVVGSIAHPTLSFANEETHVPSWRDLPATPEQILREIMPQLLPMYTKEIPNINCTSIHDKNYEKRPVWELWKDILPSDHIQEQQKLEKKEDAWRHRMKMSARYAAVLEQQERENTSSHRELKDPAHGWYRNHNGRLFGR